MYTCLCSCRNLLQKGNGWHSREHSMIRETERLLHCTREREKDREQEIGEGKTVEKSDTNKWMNGKNEENKIDIMSTAMMKRETPFYHVSAKHGRVRLYDRWQLRTRHIHRRDHVLCAIEAENHQKCCIKHGQNYTIAQNKNTACNTCN